MGEEDQELFLDILSLRSLLSIQVECQVNSWISVWILDELAGLELSHVIEKYVKGLNPGILQYIQAGRNQQRLSESHYWSR